MAHVCECTPARIRHALLELPETLDETYERTLRGIRKENQETAHRMFQFVSAASRPPRVEELADLLALDFSAGSIPQFHKDWRQENPVHAVLSTCSTLLAIVDDGGPSVIQFSHFSVKEFLTSTRLAKATDLISRRYHVSLTPAHNLVARACLGTLLHFNKDVTKDSLEDFPLAEYAAVHWRNHTKLGGESSDVEDGLNQLFDPIKPHLAICIWIHDTASPTWKRMTRTETPQPLTRTSLHYAASWDLHSAVDFLTIKYPCDVSSRNPTDDATPLHLASRKGHIKVACKLIERGADLTTLNNNMETPLHLALGWRQGDVSRMLIERGADVTARNIYGSTPLHLASQTGQMDVARILFERGADLTAQNNAGFNPLHLASMTGQVDFARMLIERGADVAARTAQSDYGSTPLHLASITGQVDFSRMLIERSADVATRSDYGSTALHLASETGQIYVARMLFERGADVAARNNSGSTPLHLASEYTQVDPAHILIERGADVTAKDNDGSTPLHLASRLGRVNIIDMLVKNGADVTARNNDGSTPLHLASQAGHEDVVRMLIERGADVTAKNISGDTPLHHASGEPSLPPASPEKYAAIIRMLLKRGADPDIQNKEGKNPYILAFERGQPKIIHVLAYHYFISSGLS